MARKLKFGSPAWRKKYLKVGKRKNAGKRTRAGMPRQRRGANRKVRRALKTGHSAKAAHHARRSYERAYQTPGHGLHNPPKLKRLKKSTGWTKAKAVKILKKGGRIQVLIRK